MLSHAWILPNFICKIYFVFIEIKQVKVQITNISNPGHLINTKYFYNYEDSIKCENVTYLVLWAALGHVKNNE